MTKINPDDYTFRYGDIVTRTGKDEFLIYRENQSYGNIHVVCIKGAEPFIEVGENGIHSDELYIFVRHCMNPGGLLEDLGIKESELL